MKKQSKKPRIKKVKSNKVKRDNTAFLKRQHDKKISELVEQFVSTSNSLKLVTRLYKVAKDRLLTMDRTDAVDLKIKELGVGVTLIKEASDKLREFKEDKLKDLPKFNKQTNELNGEWMLLATAPLLDISGLIEQVISSFDGIAEFTGIKPNDFEISLDKDTVNE